MRCTSCPSIASQNGRGNGGASTTLTSLKIMKDRWPRDGSDNGDQERDQVSGEDKRAILSRHILLPLYLLSNTRTLFHYGGGGLSIKLDKTGMTDQRWAENKGSRRRSKSIPGRSRGHLTMGRNLLGRRVNVYGGVDRCKNIMEMFARTHGRTEAWVLTCCGFW